VKNAAVMPLSRNDGFTAVDVGGAGDTDTSVDNDETVDDTAYWRPVFDDGVEASEINQNQPAWAKLRSALTRPL